MTPNEARWVLDSHGPEINRRGVWGKVARSECREAYKVLARHALDVSQRFRSAKKRAAYLELAGMYRTAAFNLEDKR